MKPMKLPLWFNRPTILSYWRVAISGTFLSAAVAMAFVAATNTGVLTTGTGSSSKQGFHALKEQAHYGLASRNEWFDDIGIAEDPTEAATEDYADRAYPADYVPFS